MCVNVVRPNPFYYIDVNHSVLGVLNSNTNPISLDLSNCGLTPSSSPALLQSLIPQSSITCLNLTGNRLRDSTMIELASLLKALTNLFTLNISCTNISLNGITSLSQCLKSFTNGNINGNICNNAVLELCFL